MQQTLEQQCEYIELHCQICARPPNQQKLQESTQILLQYISSPSPYELSLLLIHRNNTPQSVFHALKAIHTAIPREYNNNNNNTNNTINNTHIKYITDKLIEYAVLYIHIWEPFITKFLCRVLVTCSYIAFPSPPSIETLTALTSTPHVLLNDISLFLGQQQQQHLNINPTNYILPNDFPTDESTIKYIQQSQEYMYQLAHPIAMLLASNDPNLCLFGCIYTEALLSSTSLSSSSSSSSYNTTRPHQRVAWHISLQILILPCFSELLLSLISSTSEWIQSRLDERYTPIIQHLLHNNQSSSSFSNNNNNNLSLVLHDPNLLQTLHNDNKAALILLESSLQALSASLEWTYITDASHPLIHQALSMATKSQEQFSDHYDATTYSSNTDEDSINHDANLDSIIPPVLNMGNEWETFLCGTKQVSHPHHISTFLPSFDHNNNNNTLASSSSSSSSLPPVQSSSMYCKCSKPSSSPSMLLPSYNLMSLLIQRIGQSTPLLTSIRKPFAQVLYIAYTILLRFVRPTLALQWSFKSMNIVVPSDQITILSSMSQYHNRARSISTIDSCFRIISSILSLALQIEGKGFHSECSPPSSTILSLSTSSSLSSSIRTGTDSIHYTHHLYHCILIVSMYTFDFILNIQVHNALEQNKYALNLYNIVCNYTKTSSLSSSSSPQYDNILPFPHIGSVYNDPENWLVRLGYHTSQLLFASLSPRLVTYSVSIPFFLPITSIILSSSSSQSQPIPLYNGIMDHDWLSLVLYTLSHDHVIWSNDLIDKSNKDTSSLSQPVVPSSSSPSSSIAYSHAHLLQMGQVYTVPSKTLLLSHPGNTTTSSTSGSSNALDTVTAWGWSTGLPLVLLRIIQSVLYPTWSPSSSLNTSRIFSSLNNYNNNNTAQQKELLHLSNINTLLLSTQQYNIPESSYTDYVKADTRYIFSPQLPDGVASCVSMVSYQPYMLNISHPSLHIIMPSPGTFSGISFDLNLSLSSTSSSSCPFIQILSHNHIKSLPLYIHRQLYSFILLFYTKISNNYNVHTSWCAHILERIMGASLHLSNLVSTLQDYTMQELLKVSKINNGTVSSSSSSLTNIAQSLLQPSSLLDPQSKPQSPLLWMYNIISNAAVLNSNNQNPGSSMTTLSGLSSSSLLTLLRPSINIYTLPGIYDQQSLLSLYNAPLRTPLALSHLGCFSMSNVSLLSSLHISTMLSVNLYIYRLVTLSLSQDIPILQFIPRIEMLSPEHSSSLEKYIATYRKHIKLSDSVSSYNDDDDETSLSDDDNDDDGNNYTIVDHDDTNRPGLDLSDSLDLEYLDSFLQTLSSMLQSQIYSAMDMLTHTIGYHFSRLPALHSAHTIVDRLTDNKHQQNNIQPCGYIDAMLGSSSVSPIYGETLIQAEIDSSLEILFLFVRLSSYLLCDHENRSLSSPSHSIITYMSLIDCIDPGNHHRSYLLGCLPQSSYNTFTISLHLDKTIQLNLSSLPRIVYTLIQSYQSLLPLSFHHKRNNNNNTSTMTVSHVQQMQFESTKCICLSTRLYTQLLSFLSSFSQAYLTQPIGAASSSHISSSLTTSVTILYNTQLNDVISLYISPIFQSLELSLSLWSEETPISLQSCTVLEQCIKSPVICFSLALSSSLSSLFTLYNLSCLSSHELSQFIPSFVRMEQLPECIKTLVHMSSSGESTGGTLPSPSSIYTLLRFSPLVVSRLGRVLCKSLDVTYLHCEAALQSKVAPQQQQQQQPTNHLLSRLSPPPLVFNYPLDSEIYKQTQNTIIGYYQSTVDILIRRHSLLYKSSPILHSSHCLGTQISVYSHASFCNDLLYTSYVLESPRQVHNLGHNIPTINDLSSQLSILYDTNKTTTSQMIETCYNTSLLSISNLSSNIYNNNKDAIIRILSDNIYMLGHLLSSNIYKKSIITFNICISLLYYYIHCILSLPIYTDPHYIHINMPNAQNILKKSTEPIVVDHSVYTLHLDLCKILLLLIDSPICHDVIPLAFLYQCIYTYTTTLFNVPRYIPLLRYTLIMSSQQQQDMINTMGQDNEVHPFHRALILSSSLSQNGTTRNNTSPSSSMSYLSSSSLLTLIIQIINASSSNLRTSHHDSIPIETIISLSESHNILTTTQCPYDPAIQFSPEHNILLHIPLLSLIRYNNSIAVLPSTNVGQCNVSINWTLHSLQLLYITNKIALLLSPYPLSDNLSIYTSYFTSLSYIYRTILKTICIDYPPLTLHNIQHILYQYPTQLVTSTLYISVYDDLTHILCNVIISYLHTHLYFLKILVYYCCNGMIKGEVRFIIDMMINMYKYTCYINSNCTNKPNHAYNLGLYIPSISIHPNSPVPPPLIAPEYNNQPITINRTTNRLVLYYASPVQWVSLLPTTYYATLFSQHILGILMTTPLSYILLSHNISDILQSIMMMTTFYDDIYPTLIKTQCNMLNERTLLEYTSIYKPDTVPALLQQQQLCGATATPTTTTTMPQQSSSSSTSTITPQAPKILQSWLHNAIIYATRAHTTLDLSNSNNISYLPPPLQSSIQHLSTLTGSIYNIIMDILYTFKPDNTPDAIVFLGQHVTINFPLAVHADQKAFRTAFQVLLRSKIPLLSIQQRHITTHIESIKDGIKQLTANGTNAHGSSSTATTGTNNNK